MAPKKAKQPTAVLARNGGVNMTTVKLRERRRGQLRVDEEKARGRGTHLKIQLLIVETALAAVRVLIGLTSAG